ncbi:asparagine synthase (glutamine-hydrolyzing) [Pseudoalteromonas luteoviolacea]|uniref:asparagine synthase (glutamine-hydrolyzing) n=1 Tax=Pseudoalteromonas luteoviolacea TaxID=43657 RepID=UPI001EEEE4FD|nr:asparagine synthase (glutamine-hydrolyzing) [Pseudoalteromonas luteoviolacea]
MCGLAGGVSALGAETLHIEVEKMSQAIVHRGPDQSGVWYDGKVALAHRRLSIMDLSDAGKQPMASHNDRYIIAYNGEVYNFSELKRELDAQFDIQWCGHSDTEIILEAISHWGLEVSLQKFNGMFAFALWDTQESKLYLARDRFGEKPLYYYWDEKQFFFASEITCFEQLPHLNLSVNQCAISKQLQTGYIPAPYSIYTSISKVMPGCYIEFSPSGSMEKRQYWSSRSAILNAKSNAYKSTEEGLSHLEEVLSNAVKLRMHADVPLGAFLSGGVDSSLVTALMQKNSSEPINTFSIGFDVEGYNEADFAKMVAEHLGTRHHERYLTQQDALDVIPKLGEMFDEPFADASQIPMYLVSKVAKEKVTVCLSGDGGDEFFCGYKRYQAAEAMWNKIGKVPCRKTIAAMLKTLPPSMLEYAFFFLKPYAEKFGRKGHLGLKIKKFADWITAQSVDELYQLSMKHWADASVMRNSSHFFTDVSQMWGEEEGLAPAERMMAYDTEQYLPGDILTKVDRAAMQVSLEGRIPLLDPNVFDAAWRFKLSDKHRSGDAKWPLKQVLHKYVPKEAFDRPKLGFGVPIHLWLKSELKEWAGDLLSREMLLKHGIFNPDTVISAFENHIVGKQNNASALWGVLMSQAWFDAKQDRVGRIK